MTSTRLVLFIALRQLLERKVLNGIAVGGVALGVLTLITLSAMMQGFQVKFKEEIIKVSPHVTITDRRLAGEQSIAGAFTGGPVAAEVLGERPGDKIGRVQRPRDLIAMLESMPDVEAACANLRGQAIASLGTQTQGLDLRGVLPEEQERCTPLASYVGDDGWASLASKRDGVVIGSGVAIKIGARLGDRVQVGAPLGKTDSLVVVGIMDVGIPAIDNVRAYVNISTAQSLLQRPDAVGHLEVRLKRPFESVAYARRFEAMTGYESEGWQEANANFLALFDMQNVIVQIVVAAVLTLGGFGILSTQIMIVLQKTKDIAILRSVGFQRGDILLSVVIQGAIVALIGGAIGDVLGWRTVELLSHVKMQSDGLVKSNTFLVHKDPAFYIYGAAFALVVGVVASLIPAVRASRVQPVAVLRGLVG
jgi:lipoprotein-releasing system permease protein